MIRVPKYCLALVMAAGTLSGCNNTPKAEKKPVEQATIEFRKDAELMLLAATGDTIRKIEIEIADDDYERETGLMYREELGKDHGMLFIFPDEEERSFYMRNTLIPLDIVYFNADSSAISIHENTTPYDETGIPSNGAAQFVLEVNAGKLKEWQFELGDKISISN